MPLLFGKLRGRDALAWLKHRRAGGSNNPPVEVEAAFISEDASVTFTNEDSTNVFVTEATPTP